MNMGPQHPSAHGVFRAILTLEGETVATVDAVIGYLHRCHEKLAETPDLHPVPVHRVQDRLRGGDDQRAGLRARGGDHRQVRGAQARPVPARAGGGAPARRLALPLAGHLVPGHGRRARRRRHRVPLLHPRARGGARPLRVARGRAPPLRLPPGRAAPATIYQAVGQTRVVGRWPTIEKRVDEYEDMLEGNPVLPRAHPGGGGDLAHARAGGRHLRPPHPRLRGELRHPPDGAVLLLRGLRFQGAGGDGGRLLRALPGADAGVPRVAQDRPPGAGRPAGGAHLLAAGREVGGTGARAQGRGLRPGGGRAG